MLIQGNHRDHRRNEQGQIRVAHDRAAIVRACNAMVAECEAVLKKLDDAKSGEPVRELWYKDVHNAVSEELELNTGLPADSVRGIAHDVCTRLGLVPDTD